MVERRILFIGIVLTVNWFACVSVANGQGFEAFLKKGTLAVNPENGRDLFLYVPKFTLLFELGKVRTIGSTFGGRIPHREATTQDGVRVLVPKRVLRYDVQVLKSFDFVINRRAPLCSDRPTCASVWSRFDAVSDEGADWSAIWPGAGGNFLAGQNEGNIEWEVSVSVGATSERGFLPKYKHNLSIEDFGYLTLLNRPHPLYRYSERTVDELESPCGHERVTTQRRAMLTEIEAYAKAAADISVDVAGPISKKIPKGIASTILSFLGIKAEINVEAFVDGTWKETVEDEEIKTLYYGSKEQHWEVKIVSIDRRPEVELEGQSAYKPFGVAMIKKVYDCQAGQIDRMTFASFLLTRYEPEGGEPLEPKPIPVDAKAIKELKLREEPDRSALASANSQDDHFKLVDFFLQYDIPKSVANLFIKEINKPRPRR